MACIVERSETYHPAVIESLDDEGRTIVRASHHCAAEGWSVTIFTAPRSLPDLHVVGKFGRVDELVRNLVEMLTDAIEARGLLPTYDLSALSAVNQPTET